MSWVPLLLPHFGVIARGPSSIYAKKQTAGWKGSHSQSFGPNINCWQRLMNLTYTGKLISLIHLHFFRFCGALSPLGRRAVANRSTECWKPQRRWETRGGKNNCGTIVSWTRRVGERVAYDHFNVKGRGNRGIESKAQISSSPSSEPGSVSGVVSITFIGRRKKRQRETERDREGSRSLPIITKIAWSTPPPAEAPRRHSPALHIV